MNRENFRNIIKECLTEVRRESNPRLALKESLRKLVGQVITEMANVTTPEPDKDEKETIQKGYNKKGNERLDATNNKLRDELESLVHGIDPTWNVYWDDHNQLVVRAQNLLYVRIVPKFENNFDIDAMVKLVDRVRVIAVNWDQVKKFIKANFSALKNKTIPDTLHDKSINNEKGSADNNGKAAGPDNSIKNRGEKNNGEDAKLKTTKKDNQDYKKDDVERAEDQPDQPMKKVTEPGKDPNGLNKNIDKTSKPKAPKHDNSEKDIRPADKKTTKFRVKKS